MGRGIAELFLPAVIVLGLLVASGMFAVGLLRRGLDNRSSGKHTNHQLQTLQELAVVAPAVFRGEAMWDAVVDQGQKLKDADALFAKLIRADVDVFMPSEMSAQIKEWQQEYQHYLHK